MEFSQLSFAIATKVFVSVLSSHIFISGICINNIQRSRTNIDAALFIISKKLLKIYMEHTYGPVIVNKRTWRFMTKD